MSLKTSLKSSLSQLGLLKPMQVLNYKLSFLNKSSKHPRTLVYRFYSQFIGKGQLVFDIGANVGERVSIFNELKAITVAVEPQVHCVHKLRERFNNHKNIHIENIGLGETNGQMDFYICDEDDRLSTFSKDQIENSFFSGNTKWNRKETIMVLTLDSLIEKYGTPEFCKIDVEGFEVNVLKGLTKKIPAISFEFSSKQMDKIIECLNLIHKIDDTYRFNICFGEPYALHFDHWVSPNTIIQEVEKVGKTAATHAWGDIYAKR